MLEAAGYEVSTNTKGEWVVHTPTREKIVFKRDTGICRGTPYIDQREHLDGFVLIETYEGNIDTCLDTLFLTKRSRNLCCQEPPGNNLDASPDTESKQIVSKAGLAMTDNYNLHIHNGRIFDERKTF